MVHIQTVGWYTTTSQGSNHSNTHLRTASPDKKCLEEEKTQNDSFHNPLLTDKQHFCPVEHCVQRRNLTVAYIQ